MAAEKPEIVLLFARADNGVIGANGDIPWNIPADLRRFHGHADVDGPQDLREPAGHPR